jgi:N-methylhydantoinase A
MVAFGGAGPIHACDLAEELGIRQIVVPIHAGLFSAYGLLTGELTRTFTLPVMESEPRLDARFRQLERVAAKEMRSGGFRSFDLGRIFEARYLGQSHELVLPFFKDSTARTAFDARHKELYGYALPDKLEVVNIRVKATVRRRSPRPPRPRDAPSRSPPGLRSAWLAGREVKAKVLSRNSLATGDGGRGPCIIEEYDSTLIVNPSWKWSTEAYGTRMTR